MLGSPQSVMVWVLFVDSKEAYRRQSVFVALFINWDLVKTAVQARDQLLNVY